MALVRGCLLPTHWHFPQCAINHCSQPPWDAGWTFPHPAPWVHAGPDSRCQLAGRFATTASYSRLIRARIACSVSSGYKRTLKQGQPTRARWIRPSANTSRRRVACPQRTQRRGSSPPTTTPPNAPRPMHFVFQARRRSIGWGLCSGPLSAVTRLPAIRGGGGAKGKTLLRTHECKKLHMGDRGFA